MENLAAAIQALGKRKSTLESELAKVTQELQAVTAAVAAVSGDAAQPSAPVASKAKVPAPAVATAPKTPAKRPAAKSPAPKAAPASKPAKKAAKKAVQRSWFKVGEAQGLFEKLLKNPKSPPELISEIIVLKGNQKLPKPDLERFKWATSAALKAAVRAKKLVKSGGKLALPAARKPAAKAK